MRKTQITLMFTFLFLVSGMVSCTKTTEVNPNGTIERKLAKTPVTTTLTITSPVTVGETVTFTGSTSPAVTCGKGALEKWNPTGGDLGTGAWEEFATNLEISSEGTVSYSITEAALTDAGSYRFHYIGSGNCDFAQDQSNGSDLIVNEACSGLVLNVTTTSGNCSTGAYSITYTVSACGGDYTNLKLQGGLTAHATNISFTTGGTQKINKNNSVITWNVGTLLQGQTKSYTVNFTKIVTSENQNITGNWSVKGKDANNLEVVAGYNNAVTASPCTE